MARSKIGDRAKGGNSDPNILKLGDSTKVRLVDPEQVDWRQHIVEAKDDKDQVSFVVCPGAGECPMCRKPTDENGKQRWPISRRFGTNVWDYESGEVKVLIAGKQIFDQFADAKEVGYDPLASDWVIHKSGSGIQTKYKLVRGNEAEFAHDVGPDDMHDLDKYSAAPSIEQLFEIIEKAGYDYDSLEVQTFTVDEALAFQMPYGKMKGLTVEQIMAQDQGYAEYMYNAKRSDGQYGDPVFLALHTVFVDRGLADEIAEAATAPPSAAPKTQAPEPDGDVKLRKPDGTEVEVPESAVESLLSAGFERVQDETPDPEPDFPPLNDDTMVDVKVAGVEAKLSFGAAVQSLKGGAPIEFDDLTVQEAAHEAAGGEPSTDEPTEADPDKPYVCGECDGKAYKQRSGLAKHMSDKHADKPHVCELCFRGFKTKGSLTQHANREHDGQMEPEGQAASQPDPEPEAEKPAAPAASNRGGDEDRDVVMERVKNLLADQDDYGKLLDLFQKVAGKRNVGEFTTDELLRLETELTA